MELSPLPYAYGEPSLTGILRQRPEDFVVEEILGFEPEGEGEHVFLWIEKIGHNTQQLAERLAKLAKVPVRHVSYSGMKDRNAVTRQWFSVHLPGNNSVDWESLNSSAVNGSKIRVLKHARHLRKLRRGVHSANQFVIGISELEGDLDSLPARLQIMTSRGVPNYFGEQRFGYDGRNLQQAQRWFAGEFKPKRHQQGLYLSAARAYLFNQLLAKRVEQRTWDQLLNGELVMLAGSHSLFLRDSSCDSSCDSDANTGDDLAARLTGGDIHPTGPLYGKADGLLCGGEVSQLEHSVLAEYSSLLEGLEKAGLIAARRALRMIPADLKWQLHHNRVDITFSLPSGCFATSVMRELVNH
ncbi:MAG: tRNA pseudouridine(13) synthase TruD [Pseudomonadales bacterium]